MPQEVLELVDQMPQAPLEQSGTTGQVHIAIMNDAFGLEYFEVLFNLFGRAGPQEQQPFLSVAFCTGCACGAGSDAGGGDNFR